MSKLMNLKKWFTLSDTAKYLSVVYGEAITEADVLRLALDGQLKLSVYFANRVFGKPGKLVCFSEIESMVLVFPPIPDEALRYSGSKIKARLHFINRPDEGEYDLATAENAGVSDWGIDTDRFFKRGKGVAELKGVWDLSMMGNERIAVESAYQARVGGPTPSFFGPNGALVEGRDRQMYQIQQHQQQTQHDVTNLIKVPWDHPDNFSPTAALPSDSMLVVRTEELRAFEKNIDCIAEQEKAVGTTERNTMLKILAAVLNYSAIDPTARGSSGQIARLTEEIGARVSDDTIRNVLKQIPDVVDCRKMK